MKSMARKFLGAAAGALLSLSVMHSAARADVISFGDSLSDTGNLFALTAGTKPATPPYFNGRFSNGPVWTEILAGGLNSMNSPFQGTGVTGNVNLAVGGARTGFPPNVNNAPPLPDIASQITTFGLAGGTISPNDIVTIWGGANNIFDFFDLTTNVPGPGFIDPTNPANIQANSVIAATDMANNVAALVASGARTIIIPNLPNIGATPAFNGTASGAQGGQLASGAFNSALSQGLDAVVAGVPAGVRIIRIDTSAIFQNIIANGAAFGFTNVTDACLLTPACATGTTAVQNTYLFWDGVHPTAAAQALFAQIVQAAIAYPAQAPAAAVFSESVMWARRDGVDSVIDRANGHVTGIGEKRRGGYVELAGAMGDQKARKGRTAYDYNTYGLRIGSDVPLSDNIIVGGAIGILIGDIGGGPVSANQYHLQGDVYGLVSLGNAFIKVAAGTGGGHLTNIKRQSPVAGFVNNADANTFQASVSGEAGFVFDLGAFKVIPGVRLDYLYGKVFSFDESGPVTPLAYSDLESAGLFGAVKIRAVTMLGAASAYGEVGYEDLLSYKFTGSAGLAGSPGTSLPVSIADPQARGFFAKIGLGGQLTPAIAVDVSYGIALQNGHGTSHAGKAQVSFAF